jgi:predicted acylesterase/phospholipase RssA
VPGSEPTGGQPREKEEGGTPADRTPNGLDGIFSGGGSLGVAYVGALRAVREHGCWFTRVAGTSAGAFIASLVAAGYDAAELEWLLAPSEMAIDRPGSLPSSITEPIDLSGFLDPPESSKDIDPAIMRQTHLWNAIKLNAVDELLSRRLTGFPTRSKLADDLTNRIVALSFGTLNQFRQRIRDVLGTALHFYPDNTPTVRSFLLTTLEQLREDIADAVWRVFTDTVRTYRYFVNWTFEGGLFKGEAFYETVRSLLEAKVWESRGLAPGPVLFNDLPLELAVVSVDTSNPDREKRMQVYTKLTAGDMEVALAVRDSISIPLFFQPRSYTRGSSTFEIMDGAVLCNFPFWLFAGGHDGFLEPSKGDEERPKVGFILDKDLDAPSEWRCPQPKWHVPGSEEGQLPSSAAALAENPHFDFLLKKPTSGEFIAVERALRVVDVALGSELMLTEPWRASVKASYPYFEAHIPLKGYHGLDFSVTREIETWRGMVYRGYEATTRIMLAAGLIADAARKKNPYRRRTGGNDA